MVDLSTEYLGLKLKNPLIAGSSGLSATAKGVREFEENGAAAVVLKSIFEEEIMYEYEDILREASQEGVNLDQFDYYDFELKSGKIKKYTDLIGECKKKRFHPGDCQHQLRLFSRVDFLRQATGRGRGGCTGVEHVFPAVGI